MKLQKFQNTRSKKNQHSDNDNFKQLVVFVSSVTGFLQNIEQHLLNTLDQAELAVFNSINNIIIKLNNSIDVSILIIIYNVSFFIFNSYVINFFYKELQTKLNKVDLLLKNKQLSSSMLSNTVHDIENLLKINYYISIKNKTNSSVSFDYTIFETLQQSFNYQIDISPFYIMENSSKVPPGYVLTSTIEINSDAGKFYISF